MSITEIILIIAGVIVLALGYLLPAKKKDIDEDIQLIGEDEVRKLVSKEVEGTKEHILDIVDETVTYAMEKTERSMERVANEKIMAINEYSDTVLEDINKNHKEVLFLYDMLNDRHENLKNTIGEALKTAEEIKQTVKDAEITAKETQEIVKEAEESAFVPIKPHSVAVVRGPINDYAVPELPDAPFDERYNKIIYNEGYDADRHNEENDERYNERYDEGYNEEYNAGNDGIGYNGQYDKEKESFSKGQDVPVADIRFTGGKESNRNNNDRILELHKAGKSNMAIAKELGLGIGEVKLVIDLFEGL